MMKRINKIIMLAGTVLFGMSFFSCTNEVEIKQTSSGTYFKYKNGLGDSFTKTIQDLTGEKDSEIFNAADIKMLFEQTGVEQVQVASQGKSGFMVSGKLSSDKSDMINQSDLLVDEEKKLALVFSQEKLVNLYEMLPSELQNYIDLFMAPSFIGETMTNEEYIDLLSSFYGEELTDELQKSKVKVTLIRRDGVTRKFSVDLLNLLNLTGTLIME